METVVIYMNIGFCSHSVNGKASSVGGGAMLSLFWLNGMRFES